jgi:hypothetical protein
VDDEDLSVRVVVVRIDECKVEVAEEHQVAMEAVEVVDGMVA